MKSLCFAGFIALGVMFAMSSDANAGCFGQQQLSAYQQQFGFQQYAAQPIVVRQRLANYVQPVQAGCFQQPIVVRQPIALRQRFINGRRVQPFGLPFGGGGLLGNVRNFLFGF